MDEEHWQSEMLGTLKALLKGQTEARRESGEAVEWAKQVVASQPAPTQEGETNDIAIAKGLAALTESITIIEMRTKLAEMESRLSALDSRLQETRDLIALHQQAPFAHLESRPKLTGRCTEETCACDKEGVGMPAKLRCPLMAWELA